MDTLARKVRKFVYDRFRETSYPPVVEEIARRFDLDRGKAVETLNTLDSNKLLVLMTGTERILMAHPFSAITTPFRVWNQEGQRFFANCAYDSIAMHLTLEEDVRIESFCHHCGELIQIELTNETVQSAQPKSTIIYLGLPVALWWDNIVHTCSNTMLFFSHEGHLDEWLETNKIVNPGQFLTVDQTIKFGGSSYKGRMDIDYERPSASELSSHFEALGLRGPFWQLDQG